jgi:nucleotide-binding universal stress UspA family protein
MVDVEVLDVTERIVVGVDGSSGARAALQWAADEARRRQARLDVVLAYRRPVDEYPPLYPAPSDPELRAAARERLQKIVNSEGLEDGESDLCQLAIPGAPARALLDTAEGADLLVVGARGLGAFTGMLLGSVSQRCAAAAPCPVVVVRSAEDDDD